MFFSPRRVGRALAAAVLLVVFSQTVKAQFQWDPLISNGTTVGGPGSWNTATGNWYDSTGPSNVLWNNQIAIFGGAAGGTVTVDSTGMTTTGLTFNTTGYTIAPGTTPFSLGLAGATPVFVASGATASITNILSGTGSSLVYNSPGGILVLGGTNTFTGGFSLQAGTVQVNANNALGATAGVVTISGGVLGTFDTTARTLPNPIAITGSASFQPLLASGNGLLFSSALNTIANNPTLTFDGAGSLTIWSGRVTLSSNFSTAGTRGFAFTGGLTNTGGVNRVFTINSTSTGSLIRNSLIGFDTNTITFEGTGAVGLSGGTAPHLSGATAGIIINGPIIIGSGAGANTFTGGVTLNSGQVRIAATSASLTSGPLGNGTFTINGGTTRTNDSTARTFSQPISIIGDATFGGGGATLTFNSDLQSTTGDRTLTFPANATIFAPVTPSTAFTLGGDLTLLTLSGAGPNFGALNFGNAPRDFIKSSGTGTAGGTATFLLPAQNIVPGNTLTINTGVVASPVGDAFGVGVTSITIAPTTATSAAVFSLTGTGTTFTGAGDLNLGGTGTAASNVTIAANTFNLSGNVVYNGSANPTTQGLISSTGATGTQGLNLGAVDRTFNVSDSTGTAVATSDLAVSALLQGSGGLIKTGNGMLGLGNAGNLNTFSGAITINDGRLLVSADGALGATSVGTVVNTGGTLAIITASYLTAEPLTLNGSGFNGVPIGIGQRAAFETATATSLTWAGPITLGSNSTIGNSQTGGTFTIAGGINTGGFTVNFVGTRTSATPDGILISTLPITGNGGVQKDGSFDLGFNVANNYSGATVINQGRIVVRDAGGLGTSTVTVNTTGAVAATSGTVSFQGVFSIPNNFIINGPGFTGRLALDMTQGSSTANLTGLITLGSDAAIGANASTLLLTVSNQIDTAGFTLRVAGIGPTNITGVITGAGSLTKSDGNVAASGTLTLGGGVLDTAPNTYAGTTTVSNGTLSLNKAPGTNAITGDATITGGLLNGIESEQIPNTATITITNGTFGSTAATTKIETIANLAQSGGTINTGVGGTLNITNAALVTGGLFTPNSGGFANVFLMSVTAPGGVQLNGNSLTAEAITTIGLGGLTLDGATIVTNQSGDGTTMGTRLVLEGSVNSVNTSAIDRSGGGTAVSTIDLNTGTRTFNVTSGSLTLGAPVTNGGITKTGSGVLNLNAVNTFAGPLDVSFGRVNVGSTSGTAVVAAGPVLSVSSNGTLGGIGTINRGSSISGVLAPGNGIGQLTVTATQTWNPAGTYQFEYDAAATSPAPITGSDHLLGTGAATLDLSGLSTTNKFNFNLVGFGTAGVTPVEYTGATFPSGGIIPPTGMIGNDLTPFFNFTGDFASTPTASLVTGDTIVLNFTPFSVVPEPTFLLAFGALGLFAIRRRVH